MSDNKITIDRAQWEQLLAEKARRDAEKPCSHCGACPTCGRAPEPVRYVPFRPYVPPAYPWAPLPWWQQQWASGGTTVLTSDTSGVQAMN